jgi:hypothetical protein
MELRFCAFVSSILLGVFFSSARVEVDLGETDCTLLAGLLLLPATVGGTSDEAETLLGVEIDNGC